MSLHLIDMTDFLTSSTLTLNLSVRRPNVFFFIDSFVLCKNVSNKPNFIKIRGDDRILNNYYIII